MHSVLHLENVRADASARARRASRRHPPPRKPEPPPMRRRVAHAAVRVAIRLDAEAARRAVRLS